MTSGRVGGAMFDHELQRPRSPVPWIIAGTSAIGLALVLLTPVPRSVRVSYTLEPAASVDLHAARPGTVAHVAPAGRWVEKGEPVLTYETELARARLTEVQQRISADESKLKVALAPGRPVARLRDAVARAE